LLQLSICSAKIKCRFCRIPIHIYQSFAERLEGTNVADKVV
jgi:hypothetical protein